MNEQLTVRELIALLQEQPQDAKVNMSYDSNYAYTACVGVEGPTEDCDEVFLVSPEPLARN